VVDFVRLHEASAARVGIGALVVPSGSRWETSLPPLFRICDAVNRRNALAQRGLGGNPEAARLRCRRVLEQSASGQW
jgi:hypothetical protein